GASFPSVGAGHEQHRRSSAFTQRGRTEAWLPTNHVVQNQSACLSCGGFTPHRVPSRTSRKTVARVCIGDQADCTPTSGGAGSTHTKAYRSISRATSHFARSESA